MAHPGRLADDPDKKVRREPSHLLVGAQVRRLAVDSFRVLLRLWDLIQVGRILSSWPRRVRISPRWPSRTLDAWSRARFGPRTCQPGQETKGLITQRQCD